jgi:tetratricopeptide (TPR) repeat protein
VNTASPFQVYFRILVVSILVALVGLSAVPRMLTILQSGAYQSAAAGDYYNAARLTAGIAEYYPWQPDLLIQAARFAYQAGKPQLTIQYFERAAVNSYLTIDDLILLGKAYQQNGDPAKAEALWQDVAGRADSQPALENLVDLYLQRQDYTSAIDDLQKLINLNPADGHLYYQVGLLYAATDPLNALPFLAQAAQIDTSIASDAQALHDKIRTVSVFEQPAYTLLTSGRQLASMGEWTFAAEAFKQATELDPGYADAWAFLGEAEQQIKTQKTGAHTNVGLVELQHALQLDAGSALANTFMGLYWERQQDYSQAQHYLEQAITFNPSDPYLYSELGNIISKSGDLPAAQAEYQQAIHLAPQEPLFYRLLAQFALDNHIQVRELALPATRQAIILDPHDSDSLDMMSQVMLALQDYHSAERYAIQAVQSNPANMPAYLHLGTAYLNLGEATLAYHCLSHARDSSPGSWISDQAARMIDYYFPQ